MPAYGHVLTGIQYGFYAYGHKSLLILPKISYFCICVLGTFDFERNNERQADHKPN